MDKNKAKLAGLKRRQRRVRGKIFGTPERPRLRVTRTNANIYAMIVDDTKGRLGLDPRARVQGHPHLEQGGCREGR